MSDVLIILSKDADAYKYQLEPLAESLSMHACKGIEDAQEYLFTANLLLASPALAAEVVNQMPKLFWLQSTFAGITPLIHERLRKDYHLTGVKDIFGALMSEYVFAPSPVTALPVAGADVLFPSVVSIASGATMRRTRLKWDTIRTGRRRFSSRKTQMRWIPRAGFVTRL